jgi:tRNA threonylcarbamoyladenosine modification (KEOPS) complex  Pcc1 subunit
MQKRGSPRTLKINARAEITISKLPGIEYKKVLALKGSKQHSRSGTEMKESRSEIKITIKARDATALRASMNSIMRDLQVISAINGFEGKPSQTSAKGKGI